MRVFFRVFIIFFLFLAGFPEKASCAGRKQGASAGVPGEGNVPDAGRFPVLLLQKGDTSASALFASRIRQTIRAMLRNRAPSGANFVILPEKGKTSPGRKTLSVRRNAGKLLLTIPADFLPLYEDRNSLYECVSLALLAASSLPVQGERNLRNSFLAAGIVQDGLNSVFLNAMPYPQYAPVSTVLARFGIVPDLKTLLTVPLPPESVSGELYGEYSFLLLSGILKSRLLAEEDFYALIRGIAEEGASAQYEILHGQLRKALEKRKSPLTPEKWFARYVRRELASLLLPASPHYIESCYAAESRLKGKVRSGEEKSFPLTKLAEASEELQDPDREVFRILQFLVRLAKVSPGGLREKLLALRPHIIRTRRFPAKENQLALNRAEQEFFLELEKILKLEKFLRTSEALAVAPGARFSRTLQFLETVRTSPENTPWGSRLETLLRHTQNTFSEEGKAL